ncbi:hypothetical protein F2P81_011741, partial [Scophthalmus maximus]
FYTTQPVLEQVFSQSASLQRRPWERFLLGHRYQPERRLGSQQAKEEAAIWRKGIYSLQPGVGVSQDGLHHVRGDVSHSGHQCCDQQ